MNSAMAYWMDFSFGGVFIYENFSAARNASRLKPGLKEMSFRYMSTTHVTKRFGRDKLRVRRRVVSIFFFR